MQPPAEPPSLLVVIMQETIYSIENSDFFAFLGRDDDGNILVLKLVEELNFIDFPVWFQHAVESYLNGTSSIGRPEAPIFNRFEQIVNETIVAVGGRGAVVVDGNDFQQLREASIVSFSEMTTRIVENIVREAHQKNNFWL